MSDLPSVGEIEKAMSVINDWRSGTTTIVNQVRVLARVVEQIALPILRRDLELREKIEQLVEGAAEGGNVTGNWIAEIRYAADRVLDLLSETSEG
jgi:hypothetical protein